MLTLHSLSLFEWLNRRTSKRGGFCFKTFHKQNFKLSHFTLFILATKNLLRRHQSFSKASQRMDRCQSDDDKGRNNHKFFDVENEIHSEKVTFSCFIIQKTF